MLKYAIIKEEETKRCDVGLGENKEYYQSIGMTEQDVEQSYNGNWYLVGYAPQESTEEKNKRIKSTRQLLFTQEADPIRYDADEELARGNTEKAQEYVEQWLAKKDEIRENNPYIVE